MIRPGALHGMLLTGLVVLVLNGCDTDATSETVGVRFVDRSGRLDCAGTYWLVDGVTNVSLFIASADPVTHEFVGATSRPEQVMGSCSPGPKGVPLPIAFRLLGEDGRTVEYAGDYVVSPEDGGITIDGLRLGDEPSKARRVNAFSLGDSVPFRSITMERALALRARLIRFIWPSGLPSRSAPTSIDRDVRFPDKDLDATNLERVDRYRLDLGRGFRSAVYHFIPKQRSGRLILFHHGHSHTLFEYGAGSNIETLLEAGHDVLAFSMPSFAEFVAPVPDHFSIVFLDRDDEGAHPLRYFVEPVTIMLNHLLEQSDDWQDVAMIGLSGGGWTTTLYAALDPRIRASFPVAGSVPLHERMATRDVGDAEQWYVPLYRIADYQDMYLLGALEPERIQVQILNANDSCCFARNELPEFATLVSSELTVLSAETPTGSYEVRIDGAPWGHEISKLALDEFVLPVLR